jgi:hypothetical protein
MSVSQVIRRALFWGSIWTTLVGVVASVVGALVADLAGMLGALVGVGVGFGFLALTPVSIIVGLKAGHGNMLEPGFFAVVLGMWLGKFVLFIALIFWLGDLEWAHRETLFLTIVASLIAGLTTDVVVMMRSRIPYVEVVLPGDTPPTGTP